MNIATLLVPLPLLLGVGLLILAAAHDVAVRTVPNAIVGALAACGVAEAALQQRLMLSLAVGATLLLVCAALWLRGCLGGADVKLLSASGVLVGPSGVMTMMLAGALAGGILCIPYLAGRHLLARPASVRPSGMLARLRRCERWRLRRRGPLPYAVAIVAGTVFALLQGV